MNWWKRLLRREQLEQELSKELNFHIQERTRALTSSGLSEEEARCVIRQEFGGVEQVKEDCRDARSAAWLETIVQDVRYAVRTLLKTPAFTLAAIATLVLGIGANTAIFQLLDAVRLRKLPVIDPQRLARIHVRNGNGGYGIVDSFDSLTYPLFRQIRDHQQSFTGVFGWELDTARIGEGVQGSRVDTLSVTGEFFTTLQVSPASGRLFRAEDDWPGCSAPGVILSYAFWHSRFAGQPSAIGSRLIVEDHPLEIIGVTPPGFSGLEVGRKFDIALPVCAHTVLHHGDQDPFRRRDYFWLNVMGRLTFGQTLAEASGRLQAISPELMQATLPSGYSQPALERYRQMSLEALPGGNGISFLRETYDRSLWLLLAIAALVLLIACANLANLMLARASAREREFAVRAALGASPSRLIRQALSESLLLSTVGAFLSLYFAKLLSSAIVAFLSTGNDSLHLDLSLDWHMVAFTALATIAVCILLGLVPALYGSRNQPASNIMFGGRVRTVGGRRFSYQRLLVVVQVSTSFVLVTAAFLFVSSFRNLNTQDPGFRTQGILTASFDLSRLRLRDREILSYQRQLLEQVRSTPQVQSAAFTSNPLIGAGMWTLGIRANDTRGASRFTWVSPGYFAELETPILAGRDFGSADSETSLRVAIVNQNFVRNFFPGVNPLRRTFRSAAEPDYPETEYQIVGVVKNTKYFDLRKPAPALAYAPAMQHPHASSFPDMYIRSSMPLSGIETAVRQRVNAWHSDIGMNFRVFQQQVADGLARERLLAVLSGFFGVLALLMAAVGLYGVLAYNAGRRRNEIGIRVAIGATRGQIIGSFMKEAAILIIVGLALGMVCSLVAARAISALLFGISAYSPLIFAGAALVLVTAAGVGGLLPARRASRLDPMAALRDE